MSFGRKQIWTQIFVLLIMGCVTLSMLFKFSKPGFLNLPDGEKTMYLTEMVGDLCEIFRARHRESTLSVLVPFL